MKSQLFLVIALTCCAVSTEAFLFGSGLTWDDLKVTWGPNPLSSSYFNSMPRTVTDAINAGWKLEKTCGQVNGNRYILNGSREVILIFNVAGRIAGIAGMIPKGLPFNYPSPKQAEYFKDEGAYYTVNAYFQDPSTVCSGKSANPRSFETGDRVVIVGDKKTLNLPLNEGDVSMPFSKGGCFPTMGRHYYGHVDSKSFTTSIQVDEVLPVFLLYNNGKLNAFGWFINAFIDGPRWEHAPTSSASIFLPAVPSFLNDPTKNDKISSIHIFLDSTPYLNYC